MNTHYHKHTLYARGLSLTELHRHHASDDYLSQTMLYTSNRVSHIHHEVL